jgi:heme ABC exporter ATP-binding subunit CcmA
MALGVELRGVHKAYGPVRALAGVSCTFPAGLATVIAGPNGAGKSTLLAIVGTLARPTSGTVSHGDLGRTRAQVRRSLGWLGHDSLCYPDLSGRENIELAAQLYGRAPVPAFQAAAERFELGAFVDRPARTYSRGQRQRVALARALVNEPRLLLLDEPTAGLDPSGSERLVRVVREEAARGAVVVVVTHDAAFADAIGQRRLMMERGRLVDGEDGETRAAKPPSRQGEGKLGSG